jgi:hypothetical protein
MSDILNLKYVVVLKSSKNPKERITLSEGTNRTNAEYHRTQWRRVIGGKNWTINRRPGLDTLDHLCLTVEKENTHV